MQETAWLFWERKQGASVVRGRFLRCNQMFRGLIAPCLIIQRSSLIFIFSFDSIFKIKFKICFIVRHEFYKSMPLFFIKEKFFANSK